MLLHKLVNNDNEERFVVVVVLFYIYFYRQVRSRRRTRLKRSRGIHGNEYVHKAKILVGVFL